MSVDSDAMGIGFYMWDRSMVAVVAIALREEACNVRGLD